MINMSHDSSVCNMTGPRSDGWDSILCRGFKIYPLLSTVLVLSHILQMLPIGIVFNIQHSSINSVTQLGDFFNIYYYVHIMEKHNYKYLTAKCLGQYSNLTKIN